MTFWERVRDYANNKVKEQYMRKFRHDRKCPRCSTWISEVGGCAGVEDVTSVLQEMGCKRCGYVSTWDLSTPCAFLVR